MSMLSSTAGIKRRADMEKYAWRCWNCFQRMFFKCVLARKGRGVGTAEYVGVWLVDCSPKNTAILEVQELCSFLYSFNAKR